MITQGTRPSKAKRSTYLYGTNPQTNNKQLDHYSMITVTVVINDKIASDTVILKRFR